MESAKEFQQGIQKIETLVRDVESLTDPEARTAALDLVQSVMDLHGAAVERMLTVIFESGEPGRAIIDSLGKDELVGSVLLLYELHPLDFDTRVGQALEREAAAIRSHGGRVEVLGTEGGVVRLSLSISGGGCGSTAQNLRQAIETALYSAAPDMRGLEIEERLEAAPPTLVQLAHSVRAVND